MVHSKRQYLCFVKLEQGQELITFAKLMKYILNSIILVPLTNIIEFIFVFFNNFTNNQGLSIIGVSIGVTLLCLPLYAVAEKWQQVERDKEKSMKSQLDRIKQTFTGDERYMMTTAYYHECHYSPIMSLRSSFGLLIQIPFFIAAYNYLSNLSSLKGISFLFIKDLSVQDSIFKIGVFPINILPITMTIINIIAGTVYTKGFSKKEKIQINAMALIFLVILYHSPSGLVLYWTMNNVFSLLKNLFYKTKNPISSFWLFVCITFGIFGLYFLFFFNTKISYKVVYLIVCVILFFMPKIISLLKSFIVNNMSSIIKNNRFRFFMFFSSCIVLFLLTGFVIPLNLISSSPSEFINIGSHSSPIYYVLNTALQSFGLFIFWFTCIYLLFDSKVQTALALTVSYISFFSIINTFVFSISYGSILPSLIFSSSDVNFKTVSFISILNIFALFILLVVLIFLYYKQKQNFVLNISNLIIFSLIIICGVNFYKINKSLSEVNELTENRINKLTEPKPIFHLSKNNENVLLIFLDRAQGQFVETIFNEDINLNSQFEGFTFYDNTISFNSHTIMGAPGLFGGYEYTPFEMNSRTKTPLVEKNNESLLLLPRIFSEEKNFSCTITDPSWGNYKQYCDLSFIKKYPKIKGLKTIGTYSNYWIENNNSDYSSNSEANLKRNLFFFSLFRESPIIFREFLYSNGTYFTSSSNQTSNKSLIDNYSVLYYLKKLTDISDTNQGTYTCLENELTHESCFLQAPDYFPANHVTDYGSSKYSSYSDYSTNIACYKMLAKYFDYLRENNAYDNTRIVIVSDHGWNATEDDMDENAEFDKQIKDWEFHGRGHYHPILFYKDFNAKGDIKFDNTKFMTNADTPSLLLNGIVENPKNPFTQKEIPLDTTPLKKNGVLITCCDQFSPEWNGKYKFNIKQNQWYFVKDNIFDSKNWKQMTPEEYSKEIKK